jgi:hypothetical protein
MNSVGINISKGNLIFCALKARHGLRCPNQGQAVQKAV